MKINVLKPYIAPFGKTNKQVSTENNQTPEDTLKEEVKSAYKAVKTILNPSQDANLTCRLTQNGEKHISVSQGGNMLSLSKFAKGAEIPYEIEEGFDEAKKLIRKKTIYNIDGTIGEVLYGIHTDTSNIDKKVTYDKYGLSQFTFENIDNQKGTIDKVTELYYNNIPLSITYNVDMKRGITGRKESYYEDGKTLKIVQEGSRENYETGLIKLDRETHFNRKGKKSFVFENIKETEPAHLTIGRVFVFESDGETVCKMYEKAIQVDGKIVDYSKLTQFEVKNGTLYEIITTKTEEGYETKEQKVVLN